MANDWLLPLKGKKFAHLQTSISADLLDDFKAVAGWLYASKRIERNTPYAAAKYLIETGIVSVKQLVK